MADAAAAATAAATAAAEAAAADAAAAERAQRIAEAAAAPGEAIVNHAAVIQDLQTGLIEAERRLRDSEQQYQLLAEQATALQNLAREVIDTRPKTKANQKINLFTNEPGADDWIVFRRHFENTAALNGFSDEQKRYALAGAMSGKAALATLDIEVGRFGADYPTIVSEYAARFIPAAASQLARAEFDGVRQGPKEKVLDYHGRLRALYNRAYPDNRDDVLLIRKFILGLRRKELRLQAMRTYPETYADALNVAQNEASVQQMVSLTELGAAAQVSEPMEIGAIDRPSSEGKKGPCHHCGRAGHWKRECYEWKRSNGQGAGSQDRGGRGGAARRGTGGAGRGRGRGAGRGFQGKLIAALEAAVQGRDPEAAFLGGDQDAEGAGQEKNSHDNSADF